MRRIQMAALAVLAWGCSEGTSPAGVPQIAGDYVLRSIDGHAPPQIVRETENGAESIVAGIVILRADDTYVDSTDVQIVSETGVTKRFDVGRGTWRTSNDTIYFQFGMGEYAMVRSGVELVQDFDGITLVYRK